MRATLTFEIEVSTLLTPWEIGLLVFSVKSLPWVVTLSWIVSIMRPQ